MSFGSSEDGWDDGTLVIELTEKRTELDDLDITESHENLENKFATSFDLINLMQGELILDSKMITIKLPTQGKLSAYDTSL
jgi:hypothetical protein